MRYRRLTRIRILASAPLLDSSMSSALACDFTCATLNVMPRKRVTLWGDREQGRRVDNVVSAVSLLD